MSIHSRKFEPPKYKIESGETSVDALITPKGKYIDVGLWTINEEGTKTSINIQIPIKIIEREMSKFN